MSREAVLDVAERAIRTFVAVFLGLYVPVLVGAETLGGMVDMNMLAKAATAGVAAVITVIIGVIGTQVGSSKDDASVL